MFQMLLPIQIDKQQLLNLIQEDKEFRTAFAKLIADAVRNPQDFEGAASISESQSKSKILPTEVPPIAAKSSLTDPLRVQLRNPLQWLATTRTDNLLKRILLGDTEVSDEGELLQRFLSRATQWKSIAMLWREMANHCKEHEKPISVEQNQVLKGCLKLHNYSLQDLQAEEIIVFPNTPFDHEIHQTGRYSEDAGETVEMMLLSGLKDANGEVVQKPLVKIR